MAAANLTFFINSTEQPVTEDDVVDLLSGVDRNVKYLETLLKSRHSPELEQAKNYLTTFLKRSESILNAHEENLKNTM